MRSYAALLRAPHMAALLASTLIARLPIGINGLAVLLFLREETGSFAVAGAATGAMALGNGVGNPLEARLIDRVGTRLLMGLAGLHVGGLLALIGLGKAGAPAAVLFAAAFLTGAALPPAGIVVRGLYPRLVPDLVTTAYAFDAMLTEMIFIVGPLVTGALVAFAPPGAALIVSAVAAVVGTAAFLAALPPGDPVTTGSEPAERDWLGALRAPGIRTLVGAMVPAGFAFGALEVALPAFADDQGQPELAGVLIAIWSIGSAAGALVYGARTWGTPLAALHLRVSLLLPLGFVPLALAGSPLVMAVLVIPAGVLIAPLIATRNELIAPLAPAGFETEAFTWPVTALVGGIALGAAAAGALVEAADWRLAIAAATLAALVGAAVSLTRRRTLRPAIAPA